MRATVCVVALALASGCEWLFPPADLDGPPDALPARLWSTVSTGPGDHACAITMEHALFCWGRGTSGQIGDGARADRVLRVEVAPGTTWTAVATGGAHTCAIQTDQSLSCWGENAEGQLGDTTTMTRPLPTKLEGTWSAVAAGDAHTCAISATDSRVYCWGRNIAGQLGDGTMVAHAVPAPIVSGGEVFDLLVAGSAHTCARAIGGRLFCWGAGLEGQIGDTLLVDHWNPTGIAGATVWTAIGAGGTHTCGIHDGALECWGANKDGQLGVGGTGRRTSPTAVAASASPPWVAVALGQDHTCATRMDGTLSCWGSNAFGALGNGEDDGVLRPTPEQVAMDGSWSALGLGRRHSCAIDAAGALSCAGSNGYGSLGDGTGGDRLSPVMIAADAETVATGFAFTCASTTGGVRCWGSNASGQFGDGTTIGSDLPLTINIPTPEVLAAGTQHTCTVRAAETAWCAGRNAEGQIGDGTTGSDRPTPVMVASGNTWSHVAASTHVCAITTNNDVVCWGKNLDGQIGNSTTSLSQASPVSIGLGGAGSIGVGGDHTCAVTSDGVLRCWGDNDHGQLGLGDTADRSSANQVGTNVSWHQVDAGEDHTCAIRIDGTLWCWGGNGGGQLGSGNFTDGPVPASVAGQGWQSVSAGYDHTCGIQNGGSLWCWGNNASGKLGTGRRDDELVPFQIGSAQWFAVDAGLAHTCGIQTDGTLWCWGDNSEGQIGDGTAWRPTFSVVP